MGNIFLKFASKSSKGYRALKERFKGTRPEQPFSAWFTIICTSILFHNRVTKYTMPSPFFKYLILLVMSTLPLWIVVRTISYKRKKQVGNTNFFQQEAPGLLLLLYFISLIAVTILPSSKYTNPFPNKSNLVPFVRGLADVDDILKTHTLKKMLPHLVENIMGNIVLFLPLGILLPVCFRYFQSIKRVGMAGLCVSTTIEMTQWLIKFIGIYRSPDIDDIILNTTGAVVGYLLYRGFTAKKPGMQTLQSGAFSAE